MDDQFTLDTDPDMLKLNRAFEKAVKSLGELMPKAQFEKFLRPLHVIGREGQLVFVAAPGRFVHEWVRDKYRKQLEAALIDELGEPIEMVLEARLQERQPSDVAVAQISAPIVETERETDRYTFDNFVVGNSNLIAHNGAREVSAKPGKFCNPLFIYGKSGLGKTHLMWAIANTFAKKNRKAIIRYMTAQEFTAQFVDALDKGSMSSFRRQVENANLLLIDDIGFIDGKVKTEEELFHLLNQMLQAGKQVVLCSDRSPREHSKIDERLRSRFESGLVADIQPPDTATRIEIVRRKADGEGVLLDDHVCQTLATSVPGNIRTLIGAVTTLLAHCSLLGQNPSIGLAEQVVERQFGRPQPAKPTADQILKAVSQYYNVPLDQITGQTRKAWVAHARHVAVYLVKEATGEPWKRVGERFGNRDHSSIMHAHNKISTLLATDTDLRQDIGVLRQDLHI